MRTARAAAKTPVLSIIGRSGSGKTALLVRLVRRLSRKGWRIGTIKHCRHGFEADRPGKDSFRHFQAGASASMAVSPKMLAVVRRLKCPLSLASVVKEHLPGMDLVLAEGFKRERFPRIEVWRRAVGEAPVTAPGDARLVALVTDRPLPGYRQPQFHPSRVQDIVEFIEEEFL
ncbi:MAG: molybdopterin-guanine dinucleotide biosynthesis protein B [Elusimicrobia bacterium]|nr:molybdopterin-guanine dinucleotide biosynthesis protein B [Elusimicrobiota bacterium]